MSKVPACCALTLTMGMAVVTAACAGSSPGILVSLSPSSAQVIEQGQSLFISAKVLNDPSSADVVWSLSGPGTLSNATASTVTYNPPTTSINGAESATVTAASATDANSTASVQITVEPFLQIPFQNLPNGSVGAPYSQPIVFMGGTAPFQWSIYDGPIPTGFRVGGAVPDGLALNTATGVISGTPTGAGTWYFEASVTDAEGASVANPFLSIQINPAAPPENPVPFLNQPLLPTAVSPGSAGFTLGVSGTGFVPGATIDWNGTPLSTTFGDRGHLTAMVGAGNVASAGTALVTVVNPAPGGGSSNIVNFQVGAPETTVTFANAPGSPLPIPEANAVTVADFNEDGKPDIAVSANIHMYILLGNGDGTFTATAASPISVPSPPYDDFASPYLGVMVAADFNNSGHQGLAIGEFQNEAAVILLGKGDGSFAPSSAVFANALGQPVAALATGDFNADGNLDLAIVNGLLGQSPVVLGYGKGAFNTAGDLNIQGFAAGVAIGDFNSDGKLDAVVAGGGSTKYPNSGLAVSLGNGDGTFAQANGSPISLGTDLSAIVTADFNGDGRLDLAVADNNANTVTILLGNGDGTFGPPLTIPIGAGPDAMVAADFNNDGKLDLAIANGGDNTITLLLGNGDGTFTPASGSPYATGKVPYSIVAADFNGDGKLDLAVTNLFDNTVSILLQQ
ncbi:MAG TPA: FG-GAP-like repeat-containing protein [Candidatus Sulfotelmatobacter sp.]|nr:FG-GAP-like repeat-containing protein [Candidatus Sulfotelmatobacter sp.]